MKFDPNLSLEEFHRKIGVPFVKALLKETYAAFDMFRVDPIEGFYLLDLVDIPTQNVTEYGKEKLEILFIFYRKPLHSSLVSPALDKLYSEVIST